MKNLMIKEWKLAASPLTKFFLLFTLMTLIPGYPILMGSMFVCLGIFYSYQSIRENGDILYSLLLPVPKAQVVRAKYLFCCVIQGAALLLMTGLTVLRLTALRAWPPYVTNALMPANLAYLGYVLLIFAAFNTVFLCGFFRTAWGIGWPLVRFIILAVAITAAAEVLWHVPGLTFLGGAGGSALLRQGVFALCCAAVCALATWAGLRLSVRRFEKLDF
ncbi:MAG: ABC-2 transporter permease [Oscillospiraceae bacterium]|nr:ABC-2 transporter permease [Oscillospiraceae bacterium]